MPKYVTDLEFVPEEKIFRRLEPSWFDGNEVRPAAISLEGCSVDRSQISTPEQSLARGTDREVALGQATADEIPDQFSIEESEVTYESFIEHAPENGNDAHCHLKVQRTGFEPGEVWDKKKPKSKLFKRRIKEDIARSFDVVLRRSE